MLKTGLDTPFLGTTLPVPAALSQYIQSLKNNTAIDWKTVLAASLGIGLVSLIFWQRGKGVQPEAISMQSAHSVEKGR
jgi:hypothetical protein